MTRIVLLLVRACKYPPDKAGMREVWLTDRIMMSRFCFVFIVFYLTAVSVLTVSVRSANNHIFYELYKCEIEQNRLKQQLSNKQLQLEGLINPAAISQYLDQQ